MPPISPSARLPITTWNCIAAAQDPDHPQFQAAIARLATHYGKPIFHCLRATGHPVQTAENLTQEFFLRLLEGKSLLKSADQPDRLIGPSQYTRFAKRMV